MARKFLSFLGTNSYLTCSYFRNGKEVAGVRFVQEALVRLHCRRWRAEDQIILFLTRDAQEKNWKDSGNTEKYEGLETRLKALHLPCLIQPVAIPDGRSEEELWEIFTIVCDTLQAKDHVILDVTHALRSLPMLAMVVLQYMRVLREVHLEGIHYGAFEAMGPIHQVREMPFADRKAPIFDLTAFADLLDWSGAVQEFVCHGSPFGIAGLLQQYAQQPLKDSKGQDRTAKAWSGAAHYLKEIGGQISTCRGKELVEGTAFAKLRGYLEKCAQTPNLPAPFRPLIDTIADKIEPFLQNDLENCLQAVEWCIAHDLTQQGITLLHEGILSLIAARHELDWRIKEDRTLVSDALSILGQQIPEAEWRGEPGNRPEAVRRIIDDHLVLALAKELDSLGKTRNDINHAGFTEPKKVKKLQDELKSKMNKIKAEWERRGGVILFEEDAPMST